MLESFLRQGKKRLQGDMGDCDRAPSGSLDEEVGLPEKKREEREEDEERKRGRVAPRSDYL